MDLFLRNKNGLMLTFFISDYKLRSAQVAKHVWVAFFLLLHSPPGRTYKIYFVLVSVYPNLPEEGCQQSFLSLLRERALCALYLYEV